MSKQSRGFIFKKINNTRVVPVRLKIVIIFALFILVSNFTTNYINLMFNRTYQISLLQQLMAKDLKDIFAFTNTQHELFQYQDDINAAFLNIQSKAAYEMKNEYTLFIGFDKSGQVKIFTSEKSDLLRQVPDELLSEIQTNLLAGETEGFVNFKTDTFDYFGVYKYSSRWDMYFLLAEEYGEFSKPTNDIFFVVSRIILYVTAVCTVVGIFILQYILRFIKVFTNSIMDMVKNQKLALIPLKNAPNDDITYLGVAFNSLSSTIDNLLSIFKKFTNQDIAERVYNERSIRLEGEKKELTILFSDIKGFTTITETLGTDIIKLINLHYDRTIREIVRYRGSIGSIIGDAILAMFGTMDEVTDMNKSYAAIMAAYEIHAVAESLRQEMTKKREKIIAERGKMTASEEQVFNAVMIEIGVGIDGGEVFYGNIGSYVRMTNTVIGDNVNAASRLEGLTREYKVPVICSDYVKMDIELNMFSHNIFFLEIDTVQVKGKTYGRKVFWPIPSYMMNNTLKNQIKSFSKALELYYEGKWSSALTYFKKSGLTVAETFIERIKNKKAPAKWKGIWTMKTK